MDGAIRGAERAAATIASVALLTLLADAINFRSPWNLVWMIGVPLLWAMPLAGRSSSLLSTLALLALGFLTMIVTAALFQLGP